MRARTLASTIELDDPRMNILRKQAGPIPNLDTGAEPSHPLTEQNVKRYPLPAQQITCGWETYLRSYESCIAPSAYSGSMKSCESVGMRVIKPDGDEAFHGRTTDYEQTMIKVRMMNCGEREQDLCDR